MAFGCDRSIAHFGNLVTVRQTLSFGKACHSANKELRVEATQLRLGFIGAGRMATALARGLVTAGRAKADDIRAADPLPAALEEFARASGARAVGDNRQVATHCDVLFLAVKPQQMREVMEGLKPALTADHLVVSIAAGVPLSALAEGLGSKPRLVRVMPNTPCLVAEGASGYCLGPRATAEDGELVGRLLGAVGRAFEVPEKLLDAVTGLSGSGPAFVYVMIEALSDGGVRMGLPRDVATALAAQTVLGGAKMVLATGQHPGVLKDQVTSPGGTTIAGLQALEEHGVRAGLMAAVEAATRRSVELGKPS
jgi:pyrroline-5-carboxylate reductase